MTSAKIQDRGVDAQVVVDISAFLQRVQPTDGALLVFRFEFVFFTGGAKIRFLWVSSGVFNSPILSFKKNQNFDPNPVLCDPNIKH